MSNEPTKQVETQVKEVDFTKALEHLNAVEQEMKSKYAGRKGMNPFLWLGKNLHPLRIAYESGDHSTQLKDKMLALKVEEPKV